MRPYLLGSGYAGCNYVRTQMPAYANGFLTNKKSLNADIDKPKTVVNEMMSADIIIFHRPETKESHELARIAKKDGKKIVMDNDDTFIIEDGHPLADLNTTGEKVLLKDRQDRINEFLKMADLVTTTTETLAEEYRKYNKNVIVIPNCVDPMDWDEPLRNEGDKIRIGLVGSAAFEYDYLHLKPVIKELSEMDDVELILFGLGDKKHREENKLVSKVFREEYTFWDTIKKEHFPWCDLSKYMSSLNEMRLDIMLIPRKDNYFNKCKSNLKFLEASMCEIPVIAQSFEFGPYEEITEDMGVLIKDNKDWLPQIKRLKGDRNLRRKMGKNAREYVLNNYSIDNNANKWVKAYKTIL